MMTTAEKIKKLEELITKIRAISVVSGSPQLIEWGENVRVALERIFPDKGYEKTFMSILNKHFVGTLSMYDSESNRHTLNSFRRQCVDKAIAFIQAKINELQEWPEEVLLEQNVQQHSASAILQIIDRFHLITRQLRQRHDSRETLDVSDEYDVQDLFHALLKLYFDDIRAEEWTPSYAGSSSRIDFFIPELELAIELKKTRKGLGNKEAKEQLAIDKDHYRCKENIKHLICFVYDPDGRIQNPRGFEKDLAQDGPLKTDVYVRP